PIPKPIAVPAHRSANSTVWWWKNELKQPPSQSQRRDAPARRSFYQTSDGCAGGSRRFAEGSAFPAGAQRRAVAAEPLRDRSRHVDGVVAVAQRHPERRPERRATLADDEIDRSAAPELLAGSGALRDHASFPNCPRKAPCDRAHGAVRRPELRPGGGEKSLLDGRNDAGRRRRGRRRRRRRRSHDRERTQIRDGARCSATVE